MTERTFRYLVTVLLIIPIIALVDVVARPVTQGNRDLREIFYLLVSIPIVLLFYCAWFQPQVTLEMFGPFRPEILAEGDSRTTGVFQLTRQQMTLLGLGLGLLLICGCQFALGLTVAKKLGLLPGPLTPTSDFEMTRMVAAATNRAGGLLSTKIPALPALSETPAFLENTPTVESILTETPQVLPGAGLPTVGEPAQVNGISVTVLSIQSTDSLETLTPAPDNTYLVLEVVIQNVSHEGELPYAPTNFSVQDANGVQYQATPISLEPSLGSGSLPLAGVAQGYISFEVPLTVTGLVAIYGPVDLLGGNPPIQFDLGQ
jgi:hypothetical protein